jgi:hypothetical protein
VTRLGGDRGNLSPAGAVLGSPIAERNPVARPCHGGASCHAEPGLRPLPMLWVSQ